MNKALQHLEKALGHSFQNQDLLLEALTHKSYANENRQDGVRDNERLEFLGDAVISLVVSTLLRETFPDAHEGELTRRRAHVVCEGGLTVAARSIGLGDCLRLGKGEQRTGGRDKPRLLSSAFEALIGALYVDAGFGTAMVVCREVLGPQVVSSNQGRDDFKSRLQERVQGNGGNVPRYKVLSSDGPDHARTFVVAVVVDSGEVGRGEGRSKTEAEQAAARVALESFGMP